MPDLDNPPIRRLALHSATSVVMTAATLLATTGCQEPNPLLRKQGMDAYDQQATTDAQQRFVQAVEQDPTDWKSLYYLGKIRLQQGKSFEAQTLLEQALVLRQDHPETADILDALAAALFQRGRIEALHQLLAKSIDDYGTSRDYIRHGKYLMEQGDIDQAKLAYRKAAFFAQPDDAMPFLTLADFYESIGDTANAVTALRHAYTVTPKDRQIHDRLRRYGIVPGPTAALPIERESRR